MSEKAERDNLIYKICVVEDEPLIRKIACRMLTKLGHTVVEAKHATEALELIEAANTDIVFSDISMPGLLNGVELAEQIAIKYPNIKFILTTGYFNEDIASRAIKLGKLISKPYKLNDLKEAIDDL